MNIIGAALDLGTTNIKGGLLDETGRLTRIISLPAPKIRGDFFCRESSPLDYLLQIEKITQELFRNIPSSVPFAISTQRSSFLLWNKKTGKPVTPLISWMDRRAISWCENNSAIGKSIVKNSGLPFSPHYAGPKLAYLISNDNQIRKGVENSLLLFGTLETYLLWKWSKGSVHETDTTMASRTLMISLGKSEWDKEKIGLLNVPASILPKIRKTAKRDDCIPINGKIVAATIADQPAAYFASTIYKKKSILINLGTGGFIIKRFNENEEFKSSLLIAPLYASDKEDQIIGQEGTINGLAASFLQFEQNKFQIEDIDPFPDKFCIPDSNGIGAPHWNAHISLLFSKNVSAHAKRERFYIFLEGVIFRIKEIVDELGDINDFSIYLCGGLSSVPFLQQGLCALIEKDIHLFPEREGTLLGTGLLASGLKSLPKDSSPKINPLSHGRYLIKKYKLWKQWVNQVTDID